MAAKRPASSILSDVKPKHVTSSLCLEMKLNIIKSHKSGEISTDSDIIVLLNVNVHIL